MKIKYSMQNFEIKWIYDPMNENKLYIMHDYLQRLVLSSSLISKQQILEEFFTSFH